MADQWQEQYERLKRATDKCPQDGRAWLALGHFMFHESDNPGLALRAYETAQTLLPDMDLRLELGRAYIRKGETQKGFDLLKAVAADDPRAEVYCILSDAYFTEGLAIDAEEAARTAIQLESSFEEAYYLLGQSLKDRDRQAAICEYRHAISLDEEYALAWQALGRELIALDETEEGVASLKRAVRLDSEDVWSRIFLANGLWKSGNMEEAEEQYQAAICLAPDFQDLQRWHDEFLAAADGRVEDEE